MCGCPAAAKLRIAALVGPRLNAFGVSLRWPPLPGLIGEKPQNGQTFFGDSHRFFFVGTRLSQVVRHISQLS